MYFSCYCYIIKILFLIFLYKYSVILNLNSSHIKQVNKKHLKIMKIFIVLALAAGKLSLLLSKNFLFSTINNIFYLLTINLFFCV